MILATDDELHILLDNHNLVKDTYNEANGWEFMTKIITELNVNEFWDEFFGPEAKFGQKELSEHMKWTNFKVY